MPRAGPLPKRPSGTAARRRISGGSAAAPYTPNRARRQRRNSSAYGTTTPNPITQASPARYPAGSGRSFGSRRQSCGFDRYTGLGHHQRVDRGLLGPAATHRGRIRSSRNRRAAASTSVESGIECGPGRSSSSRCRCRCRCRQTFRGRKRAAPRTPPVDARSGTFRPRAIRLPVPSLAPRTPARRC